jgi:hypothetical protein
MPTKTLNDARSIVSGLIQDQAGKLDTTARNLAIRNAVELHSMNVPAVKYQIVTGVSNKTSRTPTGWSDTISQIVKIEFPINQRPPIYLEEEDFEVIRAATASTPFRILFKTFVPGATSPFGVIFTAPHKLGITANQNTIPDNHIVAVANLAASIACQQLAAFYSQSGDSLINADSVNNQSKLPNYLQISKVYLTYYMNFFKIDEHGFARPASITVDIDRDFQWGEQFFYHPRRWR